MQNVKELEELATKEDQELMRSGKWDYRVVTLNTRIVNDLKVVLRSRLNPDERWRVEQIMWFWYHHAVSCAVFRHRDIKAAQFFVKRALQYQERIPDHPNRITKLFEILLDGRFQAARDFVSTIPDMVERETGKHLVVEWPWARR